MEVTITSAGLEWFAARTSDEVSTSATVIAVGTGTPSGSGLGAEITDSGFARGAGTASYASSALTVSKTFTATADKTISEAALYTTDASPVLIGYVHFGEFDLKNGGEVPAGESIAISFILTFTAYAVTSAQSDATVVYTGNISVVLTASGTIDPTAFGCIREGICYNGRKITNGNIDATTATRGGNTWEISGYTEDYTDILNLQAYVAPIEIGRTITGKQYVNSILLPGTFRVWDKATLTHVSYTYCWISGDIAIENYAYGKWYFSLTIVQSYEGVT